MAVSPGTAGIAIAVFIGIFVTPTDCIIAAGFIAGIVSVAAIADDTGFMVLAFPIRTGATAVVIATAFIATDVEGCAAIAFIGADFGVSAVIAFTVITAAFRAIATLAIDGDRHGSNPDFGASRPRIG